MKLDEKKTLHTLLTNHLKIITIILILNVIEQNKMRHCCKSYTLNQPNLKRLLKSDLYIDYESFKQKKYDLDSSAT